ncbi:MAG TPA: dodecin family protein [Acidiferrobacterales bacterium]|nr:dodecin family protein [Acidiferrobacterales bacterium]
MFTRLLWISALPKDPEDTRAFTTIIHRREGPKMSIVKVIEILSESEESWEDATRQALQEASKTVKNIRSIYIKDMQAVVENNKIAWFRINAKISFELER